MKTLRRDYGVIFGVALLIRLLAALPQTAPNYMDAAYYLVGGQRLAQGYGFNDPYVWNYLDQPASLPHPSHLYWMPLPSILVGLSQSIFGLNYRAAQLPFIVLSALLPVITYAIAWKASASRRAAWLAALLTIFTAFYLPYWGVPESFAPFAVFGALALYWGSGQAGTPCPTPRRGVGGVPGKATGVVRWNYLLAGASAGLAHLSRADGLLLLIVLLLFQSRLKKNESGRMGISLARPRTSLLLILCGYLAVMLPWFVRNVSIGYTPLPAAGSQMLWMCSYDELFAYNVRFDLNHLLGCGLDRVLAAKLSAVASGAVHWLAEAGMIFLAPLIVAGVWRGRREALFQIAMLYAALLFMTMTLAFTFAGDRGGLFHSSGALLPFFYAAVPLGLDAIIEWVARRRRTWKVATARTVFSIALVVLAIGLSLVIYRGRVIGDDAAHPSWNQADAVYGPIGQWLRDRGEIDPIVMVNNPPGFTYQTGLPSIVVPDGDVNNLLQAARQFGAKWLILDANRPEPLAELYRDPALAPQLKLREKFGASYLFEVDSR